MVVAVVVQLSTVAVAARLYLAACRIGSPLLIRLNDTECADNMIILGVLNEVATTSLENNAPARVIYIESLHRD